MRLTAEQAIEKLQKEKMSFLGGPKIPKIRTIELRSKLREMAEKNLISPSEYLKAMKITWKNMHGSMKTAELELIEKELSKFQQKLI